MIGRTYLERGRPVTVITRWGPPIRGGGVMTRVRRTQEHPQAALTRRVSASQAPPGTQPPRAPQTGPRNAHSPSTGRPHGYARYKLDGCRCYTCAAAVSEYNIRRERAIAAAAGVDRKRLQAITNGRPERGAPPQQRVRPEIAAAILAVEPTLDRLPGGTVIDASGTRRRIQALVAVGWSQSKIAAMLGWTPGNLSTLLRRDRTIAATARAVRDLYEELWDQAPPEETHRDRIAAARARSHAAARGWLPPAAWDDDLIDIPDDQLPAELARRVALMDEDEMRRCATAARSGERSPLVVAAAREYNRRYWARRRATA